MNAYVLTRITQLDGSPRLEGRYPLRIGRICAFAEPPVARKCLYIEWLRNADGTFYSGWFRTSIVRAVERRQIGSTEVVEVTTCNSIYTFTACDYSEDY